VSRPKSAAVKVIDIADMLDHKIDIISISAKGISTHL